MQTKVPTSTVDEKRARLHGMWASVAPAWGEHAEFADRRGVDLPAGCSSSQRRSQATECSSSHAGPAASASPLPAS